MKMMMVPSKTIDKGQSQESSEGWLVSRGGWVQRKWIDINIKFDFDFYLDINIDFNISNY